MAKKNDRGRPRFLYVLISFPSDHEVDIGIPTECDVVRAILTNGQYGTP